MLTVIHIRRVQQVEHRQSPPQRSPAPPPQKAHALPQLRKKLQVPLAQKPPLRMRVPLNPLHTRPNPLPAPRPMRVPPNPVHMVQSATEAPAPPNPAQAHAPADAPHHPPLKKAANPVAQAQNQMPAEPGPAHTQQNPTHAAPASQQNSITKETDPLPVQPAAPKNYLYAQARYTFRKRFLYRSQ